VEALEQRYRELRGYLSRPIGSWERFLTADHRPARGIDRRAWITVST
jgi:hypothetical protein